MKLQIEIVTERGAPDPINSEINLDVHASLAKFGALIHAIFLVYKPIEVKLIQPFEGRKADEKGIPS